MLSGWKLTLLSCNSCSGVSRIILGLIRKGGCPTDGIVGLVFHSFKQLFFTAGFDCGIDRCSFVALENMDSSATVLVQSVSESYARNLCQPEAPRSPQQPRRWTSCSDVWLVEPPPTSHPAADRIWIYERGRRITSRPPRDQPYHIIRPKNNAYLDSLLLDPWAPTLCGIRSTPHCIICRATTATQPPQPPQPPRAWYSTLSHLPVTQYELPWHAVEKIIVTWERKTLLRTQISN